MVPLKQGRSHRAMPILSALETMKSTFDLGPEAEQYTVKWGCHSCPIRCMSQLNVPQAKNLAYPQTGGNTCVANFVHTTIFPNGPKILEKKAMPMLLVILSASIFFDDMGLWCNYGQLHRDFTYCYTHGVFKRVLSEEESITIFLGINLKKVIRIYQKISITA